MFNTDKIGEASISKDKLYVYDSYGEIAYVRGEYVIVPDDKYVEQTLKDDVDTLGYSIKLYFRKYRNI